MNDPWSPSDIPSLAGKRALVTGGNSGIGFETAVMLAAKGAHVVLTARDAKRGEDAMLRLQHRLPNAQAEMRILDLASLASVRKFAQHQLVLNRPLDILINNAGVMAPRRRLETADGYELQFGTNVLGHFLLTALLMPALEAAAITSPDRPRIITVSSIAHKNGTLRFADLQSKTFYSPFEAYQQSKLADLMFALELNRKLRSSDSKIMSIAAHPGVAQTNLFIAGDYSLPEKLVRNLFSIGIGVVLNNAGEGALPILYAATSQDVQGGGYYGPKSFLEIRGRLIGPAKIAKQAMDVNAAAQLWQVCEGMVGTPFGP